MFVDDIAPVCSFGTAPTTTVQNNTQIELTCTDQGSKIKNSELNKDNFTVSDSKYGEIADVSSSVEIDDGYKYIITVKGLSSGTTIDDPGKFTLSLNENTILDNSNNGNSKITSDEITVNGRTYTATFTQNGTGVEPFETSTISCTTIGTNTTCKIVTPEISPKNGWEIIGWNEDKTAHTGIKLSTEIELSSNQTYYAISKKSAITLAANFNANGATLACTSSDGATCENNKNLYVTTCVLKEVYNKEQQDTSCIVKTPTITRNNFEIIGYNTDENSDTSLLSSASALILNNENKGQTYYAITKKEVKIRWNANEHTVNSTQSFCTILNNNSTCTITTPTIVREGYVILGWYDESGNKFAGPGVSKEVSESAEYIATSRVPNSTEVSYDSTNSNLTDESGNKCTDVQCAIDALARITSN